MYIALSINGNDYTQGDTIEELLHNAIVNLPDVLTWEDLQKNYDIHEIGKPVSVKRLVVFSVIKPE